MKNSVKAIPIAAFNSAALLPAVWQAITPAGGLSNACFMIRIFNGSNRTITVSYDDTNINEVVLSNSITTLRFQTNAQPSSNTAVLKAGTELSFRGAIGGAGFIYLSGYYQEAS